MKYTLYLLIVGMSIGFSSCTSSQQSNSTDLSETDGQNVVVLTPEQESAISLSVQLMQPMPFAQEIEVTGALDVPPQYAASVMALFGGYIMNTSMLQGKRVNKGDVLCELQDPAYIDLQQQYLEWRSKLEYLQAEYERQKQLAEEQVNAKKTYQLAKSEYESARAIFSGIKSKLLLVYPTLSKLEEGIIQPTVVLRSPIDGYITEMNINIGMYVQPQDLLFRILDTRHLHAELVVFEKDIPAITVGQPITLQLVGETSIRTAHVYLINKEINANRTVRVHAHLDREDPNMLPGTFLHARIATKPSLRNALPESGVVTYEGNTYVFTKSEKPHQYIPVILTQHRTKNGWVTWDNADTSHAYVVHGAFDLLSVWKNSKEE